MSELGLLTADVTDNLLRESQVQNVAPTRLAVERGLLSADQAEIAEAMLAPEETIPGYELLSLLGQGGMGAVFRARQTSLNRIVALKTVLLSRTSGPNALARFEQEAVTVARFAHPHIVSAYDFGKQGAKIYLALEYVEGEDCEKFLRQRGALSEAFTWHLIRQVANGLCHAAQLGIVHRDIKPANLMLVKPPTGFPLPAGVPMVKITDFGLSLLVDEDGMQTRLTSTNTAMGSPNYMAPEQITGEPLDHRADIYALGATAYQMLAGVPPFAGMKLQSIVGLKLSEGPKRLADLRADLSPESIALVERMMSRDPADRPADYQELLSMLARWTSASGESTSPESSNPNALHWASEPTLELATQSPQAQTVVSQPIGRQSLPAALRSRRGLLWLGGAALLGGGVLVAARSFLTPPPPVRFDYHPEQYGPEIPLFLGEGMNGFAELRGEWRPATDDEGGRVLAGTNGSAVRFLSRELPVDPTQDVQYRITLIVSRPSAEAAQIDFGLCRLHAQKFHRLSLSAGKADLTPAHAVQLKGLELNSDLPETVVQLVRFRSGWLVLVNERPAWQLPQLEEEICDRIRLSAVGGTAWFSDFFVAPLRPESKQLHPTPASGD